MTADRVPPHDLDAEAAFLATVLGEEQVGAFLGLEPRCFFDRAHRLVWEACLALDAGNEPVDAVTVGGWLKARERLKEIGGTAFLIRLLDASPHLPNPSAYARTIRELARVRDVIALGQKIAAEGYGDVGDRAAWLDSVESRIFDLTTRNGPTRATRAHAGATIRETLRKMASGEPPGFVVPTGLDTLDAAFTMATGDLVVLAARPGRGKTSLAMQIAVAVASAPPPGATEACGALVFTGEMPNEQIVGRSLCSRADYSFSAFRRGHFPAQGSESLMKLQQAAHDFDALPIWTDQKAAPTLAHIRSEIRATKRELAKAWAYRESADAGEVPTRLRLVVVDYIQIAGVRKEKGLSRDAAISEFTRGLKEIAKDEDVAILALSQLNREGADERPKATNLRESGGLENDADNILAIFRPEDADVAEIIILKQRNGPEGVVKLKWIGHSTRFRDLTEAEARAELDAEMRAPARGRAGGWKKSPEDRYRKGAPS